MKCKFQTRTYMLQCDRAAFNQYTVYPTCKLCLAKPETRQHFQEECSAYMSEREVYTEKLRNNTVFPDELKRGMQNRIVFLSFVSCYWSRQFRDPGITFRTLHTTDTQKENC